MSTSTSTDRDSIAYLDAISLAQAFRDGTLSPVDVAELLLQRIDALDPRINAMVHVDRDYTLTMARSSAARYAGRAPLSALDGVPITIKDLSSVAGMPLRRGSLALDATQAAVADAPCVARLREAGLVFLGKTATPEAGCKVVTRSRVHGVTLNPYDFTKTPGGSSGGAAAALALGFGPLALGSDGAGSIRIPAAYTNVFGLKPSFGRVAAFPPDIDMPHSVVGPLSRTVADAALMLEVISRPDLRDPFMRPDVFVMPSDLTKPRLTGMRIATSSRLGMVSPLDDEELDRLVASAGELLANAGAEVTCASPNWPVDPLESFATFWAASCAATVDDFDPTKWPLLDPLLTTVAEREGRMTLARYQSAMRQRLSLTVAATAFFHRFDVLVGPVMPVRPFLATQDVPAGFDDIDWRWCPYTYIWNMTGQPAASVPIGFTEDGLPVGVQIIGRMGRETDVLRAAAAIETCRPLHRVRPRTTVGGISRAFQAAA